MPQLDVVSFFNQMVWLTVVFVLLVTSFYSFLLRPYNRLFMISKVLCSAFLSLENYTSEISGCFVSFFVLRWSFGRVLGIGMSSISKSIRPFFLNTMNKDKIANLRKNTCVLLAAATKFK